MQIPSYEAEKDRFEGLNTQVLGISTDPVPSLAAWAESLGGINYPLLSDFWPHGRVSELYGVLRRKDGFTERALAVIDAQGMLRHIEILPFDELPNNEELRKVIRQVDPAAAAKEPADNRPRTALPSGGVVMYCTKWCPDCKKARIWLAEKKISFIEVDIYDTPGAEEQVRAWCGGKMITPTFDIDGTIIRDFDRMRLTEVLRIIDF